MNAELTPITLTPAQQRLLEYFNDMTEVAQEYALDILEDMAVVCHRHQPKPLPALTQRGAS
jgi:hypothetical protein